MLFRRCIILLILAMLMCIPVVSHADEPENLLANPSFEEIASNGLPTGWYTDAYVKREGVSQFSVVNTAKSGENAVQIENFDLNDARFAQAVKVKPNAMYRLSGWIKAADIPDAGHGANLSVEGVYVFSESFYDTFDQWVYVETYGMTDKDQKELTVFVRLGGYSGESQGRAAFDDISLVEVEALPADVYADAWYVDAAPVADEPTVEDDDTAQPFWPWLIAIAALYVMFSLCAMQHLQLDRHEAALQERSEKSKVSGMPLFASVGLLLAALLRVLIALNVDGYQVDVNCFTAWGNTMANVGPTLFYQSNWCDYTPGYVYVMGLNGWLSNLVSGLLTPAFIHKLIPMACDLAAAWMVYHIACQHQATRKQAGLVALLLAFNPALIINSAAWCQVDSVLSLGLMLVAYFALKCKWKIVLPLYVLCILIKPQALMLGFLGLAALVIEWVKNPAVKGEKLSKSQKDMLFGVLMALILALVIILPFCPNQESPWWLFEQYSTTLQSYPYATVNTANIFYLFDANWDAITNPAAIGVTVCFAILSLLWGAYTAYRQKGCVQYWFIEPTIAALYMLVYTILCFTGCTWTVLGVVTMSMAFAVVLPMYIRSKNKAALPLCGAVIFLMLYIFGIKMHERYLFPALFLLGMAYALHRDRKILWLLIGITCTLFINEGIVLDNSIRLGSAMGHLNADTKELAYLLSVLNILFTVFSMWLCHRVCVEDSPAKLNEVMPAPRIPVREYRQHPCNALNHKTDAKLSLNRKDGLLIMSVTIIYALVTLLTLGSTKAPQTPWKSSSVDEYVTIDLGRKYDDFSMLYFCQVSYSNFAISVNDSLDEDGWSQEYPAQMAEGQCFQWKYLKPSYKSGNTDTFVEASDFADVQKLSGRYVRINPKQIGLIVNEVIFKDAEGNIIPDVKVVDRINAKENSTLYSSADNLLDEQDTLDGEPSWWNSTYFDEIYHARTAFELLHDQNVYEWTHPPLGKIIMSWFIALFGMTPFGWRFGGALCGILMLPAMYLLVKQLTRRTEMAALGMILMALDCMHFTQTRIATIDSYPVLFIILSYFFMLRFMQRDIILDDIRKLLPDLAFSGFFMGCGFASKWIGAYAGVGLAILYFWTCLRHLRISRIASATLTDDADLPIAEREKLQKLANQSLLRVIQLCLWCLLFFVTVPVVIYLLSYAERFADRQYTGILDFIRMIINETESMLSYHGTPGLGMDHTFYSPWYEWPLMITPMYYASAAFKPEGMTYAIFCFGNPWVWLPGLAGILYTVFFWARGHRYRICDRDDVVQLYRDDWNIQPAFILIGLLAQFLPWVLVPRGTYIYHYFASVPFLILGLVYMLDCITRNSSKAGKVVCIVLLLLCLIWFILLFPYASGIAAPEWWMDFIRDYPYLNKLPNYWTNSFLVELNNLLEKIPIFPHVYHH